MVQQCFTVDAGSAEVRGRLLVEALARISIDFVMTVLMENSKTLSPRPLLLACSVSLAFSAVWFLGGACRVGTVCWSGGGRRCLRRPRHCRRDVVVKSAHHISVKRNAQGESIDEGIGGVSKYSMGTKYNRWVRRRNQGGEREKTWPGGGEDWWR